MKYEEPILKIIFLEKKTVDTTLTSGENGDISIWPSQNSVEIESI